ncbi:crotonase/enoyl-CoA hydratase family protein [Solibacillus sp. FSL K6-1523]|uniref:crotonase/enoyl-CoA hydratase family protein n=1 Tax=Solibacillus sp. FSL K6-1523 TaxID=2921471 RepID=UPI0030F808EC
MNTREDLILTERRGRLLIVTINRPEAKNAFDFATSSQMNEAMDMYENDPELSVAIITGAGGVFSAGADLKALGRGEKLSGPMLSRGGFGIMRKPPNKPIIAAIEGHAVAGGFELALCCDLIVAAKGSKMGLPEAKHNLVAVGGGLIHLPKRMPYHLVMELALTADMWPVERMHTYGVVNRIAEPGESLNVAIELAERLLENGPTALIASKEIIRQSYDWTVEEAWENQVPIAKHAMESEDRDEGLRAFAEKRKPVWTGR